MTSLLQKIIIVCSVINVIEIILILVFKNHLPPLIPLFYGLPVSDAQITNNTNLILLPLISEITAMINLGISKVTKDKFLEKMEGGFTIFITILSTIAVIKIFSLVGSFN